MKLLKTVLLGVVILILVAPACSNRRKSRVSGMPSPSSDRKISYSYATLGPAPSKPLPSSQTERKVMKTGTIELLTKNINEAEAAVETIVEDLGGFILNSEVSNQKRRVVSTLVLKVPAEQFTSAVDTITRLGRVERKSIKGEDVTAEYVDLEANLKNAERVENRYFDLLAKAARVSDALEVEHELERIGSEIERIKGRMQFIDTRVAFSTINLTLRESTAPPPVDFGHGLGQTLQVLLRFLVIVFYVLIFLIGVAIPVVLVWLIVRIIVRKLKRKP